MLNKTVKNNETEFKQEDVPLFSVGLIADIQYADADDGHNWNKTRTRRYRQSLKITQNAIKIWNDAAQSICKVRPSLIINLGDVIDLRNVKSKESIKSMNTIMTEFNKFKPLKIQNKDNDNDNDEKWNNNIKYPFYHNCLGNHEVYNFDRKECQKYQHCSKYDKENDEYIYYYSFEPFSGFLFIILDAFVLSIHGYEYCNNKHKYFQISTDLLNKYNKSENKNIPPTATNDTNIDIERWTAFNGGFGEKQLKWLEKELQIASKQKNHVKVFIFSHIPLISTNEKKPFEIVAWDYKQCKQIIDKYKDIVKVFFAGHEHDGDKTKSNGIIHRTLQGVIESDQNIDCFGTGYFYNDRLMIKGYGKIKDETYYF